jgi:hypothetical protein
MNIAKITDIREGRESDAPLADDLSAEQLADIAVQEMQMYLSYSQDMDKHRLRCDFKCDERESDFLRINGKEIFLEAEMSYKMGRDKYRDDYELIKGELLNRISHRLKQGIVKKMIVRAVNGDFVA